MIIVTVLFIGNGFFSISYGQTDPIIEGSDIRPFTASGSIGLSANAYTASGIGNRRAPASLRTTASSNFSLFGLSSGLNMLYSTDHSRFRQDMNNLSFNSSWRWLTVQLGDVSPNFSEFGINGATIRGGYVKLTPGKWQLELSGGRSMRSVKNTPSVDEFHRSSYERWAMAGKVGYTSENNNHFFVSTHYSLDKNKSLESPGEISPQENLTISPDAELNLFKGILNLATQFTVSAYTRDLHSPVIPAGGIGVPAFFTNIMTVHTSSRLNYAGNASASLDLNGFNLELGYERIQPGFYSMGSGRIRDDQQQIQISPSLQLLNNKLSLQGSVVLGRDNLLGSRLQTQRNTTIGTNANFQLTDKISINGNYNLLLNGITSDDADTPQQQSIAPEQKQISHSFMLQPTVILQAAGRTHSISLTGAYFWLTSRFSGSGASLPEAMESNTYSSSIAYSLTFPTGLALNTIANLLVNQASHSENVSLGTNIGASYSFFDRKLTLALNGGINQNTNEVIRTGQNINMMIKSRQIMSSLVSSYRLTDKDSFSLTVRNRTNSVLQGGGSTFSELEGSFNYQHRF